MSGINDRYGAIAKSAKRVLARDIFPIVVSTGCRGLFGLVFSTILISRYPPSLSVEFFQLLLLQTVFVTFVSGAGYGRAVSASESEGGVSKLLRSYLLFALLTMVIVTLLEALILPREFIARLISPERWKIYALLAGGLATGLHSVLQGAFVRSSGAARIFYPAAGVNLVFAFLLLFWRDLDATALLWAFVLAQFAVLLAFLAANLNALRMLRKSLQWGEGKLVIVASTESLNFGIVNAVALLLFFFFREMWSERVEAELAEAAFFAVRISEIYLGVMFQVVAGSTWLDRFRYEHRVAPALLGRIGAAVAVLSALLACVVFLGSTLQGTLPLIVLALGLQVLCEGLRVPGSIATLFELQHGTALRYCLIAIPPIMLAAGAALWMTPKAPLYSFFLFQLIMSALQTGSALANRAIFERRRPLRS